LRAGIAGGDKCVGVAVGLQLEADDHRAVWLPTNRGAWLVGHLDDVRRLDDRDAIAMRLQSGVFAALQEGVELVVDDCRASHELDRVCRIELAQGEQRAGNGRLRGKVAPHGVQRDARQC
jgi:hypothetical protein